MFLKQLPWLLAAIFCLALAAAAPAQNAPSMEKDPLGYLHYLQTSSDLSAVAARTQIENGPADLAQARAKALKEGVLLDASRMQRPLPVPWMNAAPLYTKLAQMLKENPLSLPAYALPLSALHSYTPEQVAAIRKIYESRQEVWTTLHMATETEQCVYAHDWSKENVYFPELATYRYNARLLRTETYLLAAQGKYNYAVHNQARGFQIATHAASDPTLINYLVGEACESLSVQGMEDILTLSGPNKDIAAQVTEAVKSCRPKLSLRNALRGEAVFQERNFRQLRAAVANDGLSGLSAAISQITDTANPAKSLEAASTADRQFGLNWIDASEAIILSRMCALSAASDSPLAVRRVAFAQNVPFDTGKTMTVLELLPNLQMSPLRPMADYPARLQAQEAVLMAGAAAMGAWTKDSGFPAVLSTTFTDPFTGKPLGYRREGVAGFVVYSAGADGTFDGGKVWVRMPPGQIAFRYPVTNRAAVK